jgi:hypothetical protein
MRPADAQQTPTVAAVVRRAVELVDPEAADDVLADFVIRFEDRDEPISAVQESIEQEVDEAVGALDPDGIDPTVQMAGAVVTYLAFRRDEVGDVREDVLRLAARAEYDGSPPPSIAAWLEAEGVAL